MAGILLAAGATLARSAPSVPAGHQVGEESAILAALDRYVHAISARDMRAMAAMQTPDGMTDVARAKEGAGIEIVARSLVLAVSEWAVAAGCTELASDTQPENLVSQAVHTQLGFVETERAVFFSKSLGPGKVD